ncbi:hypothetical protein J4E83_007231 [Alternaria metachromatica]|uniref:uncharacterized protein n=1 Tax=Alternaria metachromatica TaxID=283354 RepID=UPI0020C321A8|nr:uncharacterized protein J4E83_007231 [Alternaria metachromatica]KAI4614577.1 hypothetical protein J4E83_007231 [Alternaria metachromatica]
MDADSLSFDFPFQHDDAPPPSEKDELVSTIRQMLKDEFATMKAEVTDVLLQSFGPIIENVVDSKTKPLQKVVDGMNLRVTTMHQASKSSASKAPAAPSKHLLRQPPKKTVPPSFKYAIYLESEWNYLTELGTTNFLRKFRTAGSPYNRIRGYKLHEPKDRAEDDFWGELELFIDSEAARAKLAEPHHAVHIPRILELEAPGAQRNERFWVQVIHDLKLNNVNSSWIEAQVPEWRHQSQLKIAEAEYKANKLMFGFDSVAEADKACRYAFFFGGTLAKARPIEKKCIPLFCRRCGRPDHFHKSKKCPERPHGGTHGEEIFPCLYCGKRHRDRCKVGTNQLEQDCLNCKRSGQPSPRMHTTESTTCPDPDVVEYRKACEKIENNLPYWAKSLDLPENPQLPPIDDLTAKKVEDSRPTSTKLSGQGDGSNAAIARDIAAQKFPPSTKRAFLNAGASSRSDAGAESSRGPGSSQTSPIDIDAEQAVDISADAVSGSGPSTIRVTLDPPDSESEPLAWRIEVPATQPPNEPPTAKGSAKKPSAAKQKAVKRTRPPQTSTRRQPAEVSGDDMDDDTYTAERTATGSDPGPAPQRLRVLRSRTRAAARPAEDDSPDESNAEQQVAETTPNESTAATQAAESTPGPPIIFTGAKDTPTNSSQPGAFDFSCPSSLNAVKKPAPARPKSPRQAKLSIIAQKRGAAFPGPVRQPSPLANANNHDADEDDDDDDDEFFDPDENMYDFGEGPAEGQANDVADASNDDLYAD